MLTVRTALALMLLASPAKAEQTLGFPLWVGLFGGWHQTSSDFDVIGERVDDQTPGAGPVTGLRLGWRVVPTFAMQLEGGLVFASVPSGEQVIHAPVRVSFVWKPAEDLWPVTPLLEVGAGVIAQVEGARRDSDFLFGGGLGVEVPLSSLVALRVMAGVHGTDGVEANLSWSPVFTLGVDFRAWRKSQRRTAQGEQPPEQPVVKSMRPDKGNVKETSGCPSGMSATRCSDVDGDGVIDVLDRCPVSAGKAESGCPDEDGDGVVGIEDACPSTKGARADWGCPR